MSNIKGGGKTLLSPEAEESIVSLLYDLRSHTNPLLPKKKLLEEEENDAERNPKNHVLLYQDLSPHEKKKKRKKFLMKLLKCHQTLELSNRLNAASSSGVKNNKNTETVPDNQQKGIDENAQTGSSVHSMSHSEVNESTAYSLSTKTSRHGGQAVSSPCANNKVRIEIVEAIYHNNKGDNKVEHKSSSSKSKKYSKSEKSKSKSKQQNWKEGSNRKMVVVAKSTNVKEFLSLCKKKLSMKKKPERIFVVDRDAKIEMHLEYDLSGLENGHVVYVTTHVPSMELEKHGNKNRQEGGQGEEDYDNDNDAGNNVAKDEVDGSILVDPLENIKRVYRMKRKTNRNVQDCNLDKVSILVNERLPPFSHSLDKLEELSTERSKLPAANHRKDILLSLDSSRVIVVQGATGCGK
jgi:HrpA-like helicases